MNHPYHEHEGSLLWSDIDAEIAALEKNGDIEIRTAREYVIGALCQRLDRSRRSGTTAGANAARIQRAADGTIRNPRDLTATELAGQKVRCPGCDDMVFQMWPEGWDAHAAHRCAGIAGTAIEERKAAFKQRFERLFR